MGLKKWVKKCQNEKWDGSGSVVFFLVFSGVFGVFWGGFGVFFWFFEKLVFGFFDGFFLIFGWVYFLSFCLLLATPKILAFVHRSNFVHIHPQM